MATQQTLGLCERFTHKANLKHTRYGWLRLTPAYSVHLVADLLEAIPHKSPIVLDPFCGTGTTALLCAERGIAADTIDINPFLVWLAKAKTREYDKEELSIFKDAARQVAEAMMKNPAEIGWIPPLHQIEKWWDEQTLRNLSAGLTAIRHISKEAPTGAFDLLKVAFCRTLIDRANVSFGHQSMSFRKKLNNVLAHITEFDVVNSWQKSVDDIFEASGSKIAVEPGVMLCDARQLTQRFPREHFSSVITSPPYPNRMSYIRELRPYMYWLGYLQDGREAGEMDWQAIGGTWGCATSNVGKWSPPLYRRIPYAEFDSILAEIAQRSPLLSKYIHKYFYDMVDHLEELFLVMKAGGVANYIIGNSKFYDVLLPVEKIFAALFQAAGFDSVAIQTIRKRTSKKDLFEYVVSARKPYGI